MSRNTTVLHHSYLSSETIAEMEDYQECIFVRLLMVSDDWGRFPYNPKRLKRMQSNFKHTEQQIEQTLELLLNERCIERYESDNQEIGSWINWNTYQTASWKNEALYPNKEGYYEPSTNPRSKFHEYNPRNGELPLKQKKRKQKKVKDSIVKENERCHARKDDSNNGSVNDSNNQRKITDMYCLCYIETYGGTQKELNKEFNWDRIGKRCQELLQHYDAEKIANAIQFMFKNHDKLWSENLSNFTSLVTESLISRAIGQMRNPEAGREKPFL